MSSDGKSFNDDLGADSLAIVELVLALEEKFDLKIPDDEVDNDQDRRRRDQLHQEAEPKKH
jgi:acyl carrier protein